ncbi:MAG: type II secretion system F family protein [Chromatiales bacterium]
MDGNTLAVFLTLIFGAVFLLAQTIFVPSFGTGKQETRRLRKRLGTILEEYSAGHAVSLVRERYLKGLSPFERWLESLPGMVALERLIEQSGRAFPAYRLVVMSIGLGVAAGAVAWVLSHHPVIALVAVLVVAWAPFLKLQIDRSRRFAKFEEQLPEALDVMTRALRAGHPFNETLQMVSKEMDEPIASELGMTFDEINYGVDVRRAFQNLLARVPSMSLMALVTSVLVQRETGGNLAEILDKISKVIRGRFRFQRRVRTLSAEGRLSAWVLALVPFGLFGMIAVTNPDYLTVLITEPVGRKLIVTALVLMVIGSFWIRKLLRIEV